MTFIHAFIHLLGKTPCLKRRKTSKEPA